MNKKYIRSLFMIVTLVLGIVIGIFGTLIAIHDKTSNNIKRVDAVNPPGTVVELIAVTEEGVKLYRIITPKGIVPTFMSVSPNGSVAIR